MISTLWLSKFYTMTEPGPINNSSVICSHGGVMPSRVEATTRLATAVPSLVWSYLPIRFWWRGDRHHHHAALQQLHGGGDGEVRQKEFELKEFKMLLMIIL